MYIYLYISYLFINRGFLFQALLCLAKEAVDEAKVGNISFMSPFLVMRDGGRRLRKGKVRKTFDDPTQSAIEVEGEAGSSWRTLYRIAQSYMST